MSNTLVRSDDGKIVVPVLLGPTAVGKTRYALELAQLNGWEVLSCDSRQIYRGMDIGTAKPLRHELELVKHWLIDTKDPSEIYSAFDFATDAAGIIRHRASAGTGVILCGGTGLYFKALSEGFSTNVQTDPSLKASLMERGKKDGSRSLYDELLRVDPDTASSIHHNDLQRIVRALAVYLQTSVPFSKSKSKGNAPADMEFRTIILTMERTLLYKRIDQRVDQMIELGLVKECSSLLDSGITSESPGLQCVGYKELTPFFKQELSLCEAIVLIKQNSRRYAKRQSTWFSHQVEALRFESGTDSAVLHEAYTKKGH